MSAAKRGGAQTSANPRLVQFTRFSAMLGGMTRRSILFDCDPGVDDAVAILLALAAPDELDVIALTAVAGNAGLTHTARNARALADFAGRSDLPVYAGAAGPLLRAPVEAGDFHGPNGLGDQSLPESKAAPPELHAVQAMIDAVRSRPAGSVTLVVTGPLTNAALALRLAPDLAGSLGALVIMGGADHEGGNITPHAEFNVFADPHSAAIVARSGIAQTWFSLDVTHQMRSTPARVERLMRCGGRRAEFAARLMAFSNRIPANLKGTPGAPLHDPCTIAWLLRPDLFRTEPVALDVVTDSGAHFGQTVLSRGGNTAHWAVEADADGIFSLLEQRLAP